MTDRGVSSLIPFGHRVSPSRVCGDPSGVSPASMERADGSPEPCAECGGTGGVICPDCGHASWIEESVDGAGAAVDGARSAQATRPTSPAEQSAGSAVSGSETSAGDYDAYAASQGAIIDGPPVDGEGDLL